MKLQALVAVLGLLAACGVPPDSHDPATRVEVVQALPFHSQGAYFSVVDDGSSYAQQLFDHVPVDRSVQTTSDVARWRIDDGHTVIEFSFAPRVA